MNRVILIDIGNVLVNYDLQKLLKVFMEGSGKSPLEIVTYLAKSGLGERYEKGQIPSKEFFETAQAAFGSQGDFEHFKEAWNAVFQENEGGIGVFRDLKKKGPVFLASNTNELHYKYLLEHFPFLQEADGAVLSHEIGFRKPERDFYLKALEKTGAQPAQALLIDDLAKNIEGARALGIAGIQYTTGPALRWELANSGITF